MIRNTNIQTIRTRVFILFEGHVTSGTEIYQAGHNLILAHAKAYRVYDEKYRASQHGENKVAKTCVLCSRNYCFVTLLNNHYCLQSVRQPVRSSVRPVFHVLCPIQTLVCAKD